MYLQGLQGEIFIDHYPIYAVAQWFQAHSFFFEKKSKQTSNEILFETVFTVAECKNPNSIHLTCHLRCQLFVFNVFFSQFPFITLMSSCRTYIICASLKSGSHTRPRLPPQLFLLQPILLALTLMGWFLGEVNKSKGNTK